MKCLILDTSAAISLCALFLEERCVWHEYFSLLGNTTTCASKIHSALQYAHCTLNSLDCICITTGPGSYTGMRVACAYAQAFSFVHNIPVVALSSFYAYVPQKKREALILLDAKLSGVYVQKVAVQQGNMVLDDEIELWTLDALIKQAPFYSLIISPDAESIMKRLKSEGYTLYIQETVSSAENLYLKAKENFKNGEVYTRNIHSLLYLRKTQAEMDKLQKGG